MEHNADFTETRGKLFLTGKEPSALTFILQVTWGRYGGVAHLPEWFHLENRMLSPEQEILLQKLKTALDGEELQIMNSILAQFALYWEYR